MAKDNRTITGSVRIGAYTYVAGQEDEFEAAASPEQIERLTKKGVISGDFKGGKKSIPEVESAEASVNESADVEASKAPKVKTK